MKKKYVILGIVALIIIVAVVSNPSAATHKEIIKTKLNAYLQKSMAEKSKASDDEWSKAGNALGMMFGNVMVNGIVDNLVSTDNYLLFSITKMNWEGESKTIGVGAFGNVYINGKLDEALNKGLVSAKE